jgi:hypothetical protein
MAITRLLPRLFGGVAASAPWSLPGLTRQSISFARRMLFTKQMDARIKSGHDENDQTFST